MRRSLSPLPKNSYNTRMELPTLNPSATAMRRCLLELPREELLAWLQTHGQPPLRTAAPPLDRRRSGRVVRADDRPAASSARTACGRVRSARHHVDRRLSSSDGTQKLLLRLHDGQLVECVLLQEGDRRTVCISTQVGCGMGCVFCASGIDGVVRNLTAGEILEQLLHAPQPAAGRRTAHAHRRHGHGRAAGQPRQSAGSPGRRPRASRRPGHRRSAHHDLDGRPARPRSAGSPTWASSITWPCRCTPPTTRCALRSCRPTTRPAWRPSWRRPIISSRRPAGR